jgi:hypothetical protein
MKIINNSIPSINTYDPRNPTITWSKDLTAGALELQNNSDFEIEAWYCLFSCEHSFKIYNITELIDTDTLNKILDKQAYIVLDNTLEPFEKSIDSIYENLVVTAAIPASQIILLTNMYDAKSYSEEVAKKLNQESIKIFWYTVFEQDLQHALIYTIYTVTDGSKAPATLAIKKYPKKFLYFNRRWRLHRPFLITLMHGKDLLDSGYVSFGPCDGRDTWQHKWPELMHYFRNNLQMTEILHQYDSVKKIAPLFLDTKELHINRAESTTDTNIYYENSYFSIISETTYFTNEWYHSARFLSEKVFKAIAMKHPFILVSVPNSLDILKIMGYKTFSPLINESYDQETDDATRMMMILKEIERLCNLNEKELESFLLQARQICNYNYKILMSKKNFIKEL